VVFFAVEEEDRDDFLKQVWFLTDNLVFFFVDIEEYIVMFCLHTEQKDAFICYQRRENKL